MPTQSIYQPSNIPDATQTNMSAPTNEVTELTPENYQRILMNRGMMETSPEAIEANIKDENGKVLKTYQINKARN